MTEEVSDIEPLRGDISYLKEAVREVHTAIIGDERLGHRGLVARVDHLEQIERDRPQTHGKIEQNRIDGDKRSHERIDETNERITEVERQFTASLAGLTQEVKTSKAYLIGVGVGSAILGGGGVWGLTQALGQ